MFPAALSRGNPFEILQLAEQGEIQSVTSPPIIDEYRDVLLRDRLPFTEGRVEDLITKVLSISRVVEPAVTLTVVDDDPDDDKILECAVAVDANYVISGDSHLQDMDAFRDIDIVSPAAFLDRTG